VSDSEPRARADLDEAGMAAVWYGVMDAWNERDFDTMLGLLMDEVVLRTDPDWPGGGEFKGRAAVRDFMDEFIEPWGDVRYEVTERAFRIGDRLVERRRWSGKGRASGIEGTIEFTSIIGYDGSLVASCEVFLDHEVALRLARDAS
jgi:ketosteroid isomerase-like protein